MILKRGRYGDFLACSGFPECKNTNRFPSTARPKVSRQVPAGRLQRRGAGENLKAGQSVLRLQPLPGLQFATGTNRFPAVPGLRGAISRERTTKKQGTLNSCLNPDCGFKERSNNKRERDSRLLLRKTLDFFNYGC